MNTAKTLAFAGQRPHKLPWGFDIDAPAALSLKISLRERLIRLIEDENVRHFISGMEMGLDTLCAETVLELKTEYPEITLEAAVPSREQDLLWPQERRDRYAAILRRCDSIWAAGDVPGDDSLERRNHYMAQKCDLLMAIGGAPYTEGNTLAFAREMNKQVVTVEL